MLTSCFALDGCYLVPGVDGHHLVVWGGSPHINVNVLASKLRLNVVHAERGSRVLTDVVLKRVKRYLAVRQQLAPYHAEFHARMFQQYKNRYVCACKKHAISRFFRWLAPYLMPNSQQQARSIVLQKEKVPRLQRFQKLAKITK